MVATGGRVRNSCPFVGQDDNAAGWLRQPTLGTVLEQKSQAVWVLTALVSDYPSRVPCEAGSYVRYKPVNSAVHLSLPPFCRGQHSAKKLSHMYKITWLKNKKANHRANVQNHVVKRKKKNEKDMPHGWLSSQLRGEAMPACLELPLSIQKSPFQTSRSLTLLPGGITVSKWPWESWRLFRHFLSVSGNFKATQKSLTFLLPSSTEGLSGSISFRKSSFESTCWVSETASPTTACCWAAEDSRSISLYSLGGN